MKIKVNIFIFTMVLLMGCAQDKPAPQAAAEADAAAADAAATAEATAEQAATLTADAVASGDAEKGQRLFIFCQACHTTQPGGANKVGPNLAGVVGRQAAQAEGFVFSAPLTESGIVWNTAALDKWIENPAALVPGTTMVFAGIKDAQQRADLIAYLQEATQ